MTSHHTMRLGGTLLSACLLASGCGADVVEVADAPPSPAAARVDPGPSEGASGARDPDAQERAGLAANDDHARWLRSAYVRDLDPRSLTPAEGMGDYPFGARTFEQAVDAADLVVSGEVTDLLFIPEGTLTTLRVDRTAKGRHRPTIYLLQTDSLARDGGKAHLIHDRPLPMLFVGDRAVLAVEEYPTSELMAPQSAFLGDRLRGEPVCFVTGGGGQYRSAGGRVHADEERTALDRYDRRFDGRTEDELLNAAAARTAKR